MTTTVEAITGIELFQVVDGEPKIIDYPPGNYLLARIPNPLSGSDHDENCWWVILGTEHGTRKEGWCQKHSRGEVEFPADSPFQPVRRKKV